MKKNKTAKKINKNQHTPKIPLTPVTASSESNHAATLKKNHARDFSKIYAYSESLVYLLVPLPTSTLNGIAAVINNPADLSKLTSLNALGHVLSESSTKSISYGLFVFCATEGISFFFNKRYLKFSFSTTLDLLKRTALTLKSNCFSSSALEPIHQAGLIENGLSIWSLISSFVFAEMGSQAFSSFGSIGKTLGFSLNLATYFASRFSTAKLFFDHFNNQPERLKQYYIHRLSLLPRNTSFTNNMNNNSLVDFLNQVDDQWNKLPKKRNRLILLDYVAPVIGYIGMGLTALPILTGFIPEGVAGIEKLTGLDIGYSHQYQNSASFMLGIFAGTLTLFFYQKSIHELPNQLLETLLCFYEAITHQEGEKAFALVMLTLIAFISTYSAGIGFQLIAQNAVTNGSLSYLPNWISHAVPGLLSIGSVMMLWSHIQHVINHTYPLVAAEPIEIVNAHNNNEEENLGLLAETDEESQQSIPITAEKAIQLLSQPDQDHSSNTDEKIDKNIVPLVASHHFGFFSIKRKAAAETSSTAYGTFPANPQ